MKTSTVSLLGVCLAAPVLAVTVSNADLERRLLERATVSAEHVRRGPAAIRVVTKTGRPVAGAYVTLTQQRHEFLFGCILFDLVRGERPLQEDRWRQRFTELFNFGVLPFYWASYEPRAGAVDTRALDRTLEWCLQEGITAKGHPLVWTNKAGVPGWVRALSPAASLERVLGRVEREVRGFRGRIDIWDVVNEPVNCRTWQQPEHRDYLDEPIQAIADYVDRAFRRAHAANPAAHLILNEFNTIARPEVRERFYRLVLELRKRGTPISGLGIQAHEPREHWYPPAETWETLDRLASLGYPLHITEFIPQSSGKPITGGARAGTWDEQTQADFAEQFYRLCFGHPAVKSINWWGFTDRRIWLPGGGLLDADCEPKPVYERLHDLIRDRWWTRSGATTDGQGHCDVLGYFGNYAVDVVLPDGRSERFLRTLHSGQPNAWTLAVATPRQTSAIRDLSANPASRWRPEAGDWFEAGAAAVDPCDPHRLVGFDGGGVMINGPTGRTRHRVTRETFGDVMAHVEFLIPEGSNSGVYLQGRYEVQVYDSWGKQPVGYIDCGGIYERWDPRREHPGYEGHAPRVNASRPAGQWQSFDVIFRAPRFDASGRKTANARFVKVLHNGVLVHENVEVTGPTRAALYADEQPRGPLMLQGDHGPVAYRHVWVRPLPTLPSQP